ncbi:hypothetical protein K7432_018273, partial [Basidiobolus ranarum]
WEQFIQQALFACRIRSHFTTGLSPFFLVYGQHPILPGDIIRPKLWDLKNPEDLAEYRAGGLEELNQH